jgi:hypothetical protein
VKPRKNQSQKHKPQQAASQTLPSQLTLLEEPDAQLGFRDDLQKLYFDEWRYLATGSLGGYIPTKLWTTYLPQLTYTNAALRHAALSIGALSLALSSGDSTVQPSQKQHHNKAIEYYCDAMRLLGQANARSTDLQDAMLVSILLACFEGLRLNKKSSLQHISSGFALLHDLLVGPNADSRMEQMAPEPSQLIVDVVALYARLGIQTQTVKKGTIGASSGAPPITDRGLEKGVHSAANTRLGQYLKPRAGLDFMPAGFSSLAEAWEHFTATERRLERHSPQIAMTIAELFERAGAGTITASDVMDKMEQDPLMHSFYEEAKIESTRWLRAFEPLYRDLQLRADIDPASYLSAVQLRILYLGWHLWLCFGQRGNFDIASALTDVCREANELCELTLTEQQRNARGPAGSFAIHSYLTQILIFNALNCRDLVVRENAIRILSSYPRRDGLWDGRSFAEVGKRNRQVERQNAVEGSVKEQWHRLLRRVFLFEDAGARIVFRFMERDALSSQWELVEEYADVDGLQSPQADLEWKRRPLSSDAFTMQWARTSEARSKTTFPEMGCSAPRFDS